MSIIYHKEKGTGYPIVLLHGFCEDHSIWDDFMSSLSVYNRVLCPDLPGFGQSPLLPETTIENVAAHLYDWLKSIDIFECIIIGHSLGGYVCLAIEEAYPNFMKAYGLFHSSALADSDEKKESRTKTIASIKDYGKEPFLKTFVPSLFNPNRMDEYSDFMEQSMRMGLATNTQTLIAYTAAMRDRKERIQLIKPDGKAVLFIAGAKDNAIPLEKSMQHKNHIHPNHFHILDHVGHMGFMESPVVTLGLIQTFVSNA